MALGAAGKAGAGGPTGGTTGASRANWQVKNPARFFGGAAVLAALLGGGIFMSTRDSGKSLAEESVASATEASDHAATSANPSSAAGGTPVATAEDPAAAAQASSPNGTASPYPEYTQWVRAGSPPPPNMPVFPGEGIRSPKVLRTVATKGTWHVLPEKDPKTGEKWAALKNRLVYLLWSKEKAGVLLDALSDEQKRYLCKHIDMIRQLAEGGGANHMDDFAAAVLGTQPPTDILSRRRYWLDAMLMSQYLREALPKDAQHLGLSAFGLAWQPEVGEVKDGLKHMKAQAAKAREIYDGLPAHPRNWFSRMFFRFAEKIETSRGREMPNYRSFEGPSRERLVEDYAKRQDNMMLAKYFGSPKVRRMAEQEEARRDAGVNSRVQEGASRGASGTWWKLVAGAAALGAYNVWRRSPGLIPKGPFWQFFFGQSPQAAAA